MKTQYVCKKCGWSGMVNGQPRCMACARVAVREWRKNNPEKARAQRRRYEKKFRSERPDEYNRRRRLKRSKKRMREAWARRVEWLKGGDVTKAQLVDIFNRDGHKCVYCGGTITTFRPHPNDPRGFDHVVPRVKGGLHTAANIVACCKNCNAKKSG